MQAKVHEISSLTISNVLTVQGLSEMHAEIVHGPAGSRFKDRPGNGDAQRDLQGQKRN